MLLSCMLFMFSFPLLFLCELGPWSPDEWWLRRRCMLNAVGFYLFEVLRACVCGACVSSGNASAGSDGGSGLRNCAGGALHFAGSSAVHAGAGPWAAAGSIPNRSARGAACLWGCMRVLANKLEFFLFSSMSFCRLASIAKGSERMRGVCKDCC